MIRQRRKSEREATIALINIVFLLLVFFLVAGTVAQKLDASLQLVNTADLEGNAPANALVILPDGALSVLGAPVADAAEALAKLEYEDGPFRIVPDRSLLAKDLVRLGAELRAAGAESVVIVTERALE
jgi:biopolymer transport protein ExbD